MSRVPLRSAPQREAPQIQRQGLNAGISTEIPDFIARLFRRAIDAGYGQKNVMSIAKVLGA